MEGDFGSLYDEFTRDAVVEDAARADAFPTFPSGKYVMLLEGAKPGYGDNPDFERLYERPYARIRGRLSNLENGTPIGVIFFDVSWEERRVIAGKSVKVTPDVADDVRGEKLDRESKLWGNLEAALTNGAGKMSVGAVIDMVNKGATTVLASISESFKLDDGSWKSTRDASQREAWIKAGHKAFNGINTIKALA